MELRKSWADFSLKVMNELNEFADEIEVECQSICEGKN